MTKVGFPPACAMSEVASGDGATVVSVEDWCECVVVCDRIEGGPEVLDDTEDMAESREGLRGGLSGRIRPFLDCAINPGTGDGELLVLRDGEVAERRGVGKDEMCSACDLPVILGLKKAGEVRSVGWASCFSKELADLGV